MVRKSIMIFKTNCSSERRKNINNNYYSSEIRRSCLEKCPVQRSKNPQKSGGGVNVR